MFSKNASTGVRSEIAAILNNNDSLTSEESHVSCIRYQTNEQFNFHNFHIYFMWSFIKISEMFRF